MKAGSTLSMVTVHVEGLLSFFDEKPGGSEGHATGIVGVVGEDLNTACFVRYMESSGHSAEVLKRTDSDRPLPVTTGKQKGPRLDRWIQVDWRHGRRTVFQAEIKNWSSHALGGKVLPVSATQEEVTYYRQTRWERQWDQRRRALKHPETKKVLVRMKYPDCVEPRIVRPLLIFWEAIGPRNQGGKHLFKVDSLVKTRFEEVPAI